MPQTKIINVQTGDTFDELMSEFRDVVADEVIFIVPKKSLFTKNQSNLDKIKESAESKNLKISIMSSDPLVAELASSKGIYTWGVTDKEDTKEEEPPGGTMADLVSQNQDDPMINNIQNESEEDPTNEQVNTNIDEEPSAELAMAKFTKTEEEIQKGRFIRDIIPSSHEEEETIEIKGPKKYKEEKVMIKNETIPDKIVLDESKDELLADLYKEEEKKEDQNVITKESVTEDHEEEHSLNEEIEDENVKKRLSDQKKSSISHVEISKLWAEEEKIQRSEGNIISRKRFLPSFNKKVVTIIGSIAVIGMIAMYMFLGSASITIFPKKEVLDFAIPIVASSVIQEVDIIGNKIPGQKFFVEKTREDSFDTTGTKEVAQKSRGEITIQNTSSTPQKLIATTRFRSANGLIYRIPESITVPSGTKDNPGSIVATIFADKPGEEYNIDPTEFVIPGFEGSPRFNDFKATSKTKFTGGIIGNAKVVTSDDFNKARESIMASIKEDILTELRSQSGNLIVPETIKIQISEPKPNVVIGEATDKLIMSVSGSATVIAFRDTDVMTLLSNYVEKDNKLIILKDSLKLSYLNPSLNSDSSQFSFTLHVVGNAGININTEPILKDISGMNGKDAVAYFKAREDINLTKIVLSPFWVRSIPKDNTKIEIKLDFSK